MNSPQVPSSDFDAWATTYDEDVAQDTFPFTGYTRVLDEAVRLAQARPGMSVLDLGVGTGNLAGRFARLGCELWCTDFSSEMLAAARLNIPTARFFLHDLRQPFPPALQRRFERIVSAYTFHHFELPEKATVIRRLLDDLLAPDGRLVIADISFPSQEALDALRQAAGDEWEDEPYWIASEAAPALEALGVVVGYVQVSECAGVYRIKSLALSNILLYDIP